MKNKPSKRDIVTMPGLDAAARFRRVVPYLCVFPVVIAVVLAGGCGHREPEVIEYDEVLVTRPAAEMPSDFVHPPIGDAASPAPAVARPAPTGKPLTWAVPETWKEEPGQGMRLATFVAEGEHGRTECGLVTLSGSAGGLPANVNRWIGQLGMDPLAETELEAFISKQTEFETAGGDAGTLIDLVGLDEGGDAASESMMVGVVTRAGQTVFIKMVGPKPALRAERDRLLAFCGSID